MWYYTKSCFVAIRNGAFLLYLKKSTKTVEIVSVFRQLINFFSPSDYFTIYTGWNTKAGQAQKGGGYVEYDGILIGQAVRDIRTERGLTIEELSDQVGKSVSHIHQLELGSRKMSVDLLLAFVSVLDTDANRILRIEKTEAVCDKGQKSSTEVSIDEELDKLPVLQREYLKKAFLNMIQTIPAMS